MRKKFTFALISLLMVPLIMMAQGTKGNTITFDSSNSTMLFTDLEQDLTTTPSFSCYLRHNQAPIQVLNANPTGNGNTIAPLQSANGTGFFANTSLANNMAFSSPNGYIQLYNLGSKSSNWSNSPYKYICFSVIAPKGYRFTEYSMTIDGSQGNGANGATIMRYTYINNTTYQFTPCSGESLALTRDNNQDFTHTLSNAGNMLYFRVEVADKNTQWCVTLKELKLTYVIDTDVEATIPNEESASGTQVHTGYINLGNLNARTTGGTHYFSKVNVNDLENVNIVADNGTSAISVKNGAIEVPAGTYWIESPAKFRFTGAKLNFKQATAHTETTYTNLGQDLQAALGQTVKIGNGSNFIVYNGGNSFSNGTQTTGTTWIITKVEDTDNKYYIKNESGNYLKLNSSNALTVAAGAFEWTYYEEYDNGVQNTIYSWFRHQTSDHCFIYVNPSNGRHYGLQLSGNTWRSVLTNDNRDNSDYIPTPISFVKVETTTYGAEDFVATLYGANGTDVAGRANISTSNPTGSVEVTGLNNDGVKFSVNGSAAFTVDLTMQPLDPNVQTLEVGYLPDNAEVKPNNSVDNVSVTSSNFEFNNGEVIAVPIRPEDDQISGATHQIVFRNAYNESRIDWYDGTATGLSNYHLLGCYDESGTLVTSEDAPYAKVDANTAGTNKIEFSNIKSLTRSGGSLTEKEYTTNATAGTNQWNKNTAGFQEIRLADNAEKTVYIFTADEPLYRIMTVAGKNQNKHVAFTFYTAKVMPIKVNETPVVEVTPIYTESFKGDNTKVPVYNTAMQKSVTINKDTELDTNHTFYGVTVTSKSNVEGVETLGYLTGQAIVEAIRTAMTSAETENTYGASDPFRTLLYVDMSSLKSISGDENTWKEIMLGSADNCLFFMPSNFAISQSMVGGGIIAGGDNGVAVTDITIIDQQPFYTPHNFRTSTHLANYTRKVTPVAGHEDATTVTVVLPFDVNLSEDGHLKKASDDVDQSVQFFKLSDNIVKNVNNDKIYDVVLSNVKMGRATAGTPYIVKTDNSVTGGTVFGVSILGANFAKGSNIKDLLGQDDSFISKGTFSGTVVRNEEIFYFSKDYFWNSKNLTDNYVNIRPFRAWYKSTDSSINALARFGLLWDEEISGISEMLTTAPATGVVYDIQGRVVSSNGLTNLPKGLYIMNGKKIFVK